MDNELENQLHQCYKTQINLLSSLFTNALDKCYQTYVTELKNSHKNSPHFQSAISEDIHPELHTEEVENMNIPPRTMLVSHPPISPTVYPKPLGGCTSNNIHQELAFFPSVDEFMNTMLPFYIELPLGTEEIENEVIKCDSEKAFLQLAALCFSKNMHFKWKFILVDKSEQKLFFFVKDSKRMMVHFKQKDDPSGTYYVTRLKKEEILLWNYPSLSRKQLDKLPNDYYVILNNAKLQTVFDVVNSRLNTLDWTMPNGTLRQQVYKLCVAYDAANEASSTSDRSNKRKKDSSIVGPPSKLRAKANNTSYRSAFCCIASPANQEAFQWLASLQKTEEEVVVALTWDQEWGFQYHKEPFNPAVHQLVSVTSTSPMCEASEYPGGERFEACEEWRREGRVPVVTLGVSLVNVLMRKGKGQSVAMRNAQSNILADGSMAIVSCKETGKGVCMLWKDVLENDLESYVVGSPLRSVVDCPHSIVTLKVDVWISFTLLGAQFSPLFVKPNFNLPPPALMEHLLKEMIEMKKQTAQQQQNTDIKFAVTPLGTFASNMPLQYEEEDIGKELQDAAIWSPAADPGHRFPQFYHGSCQFQEEEVCEDEKEEGGPHAQYYLANCYYHGEGVEQDREEAVRWFKIAADQGHSRAQNTLANCYYAGEGVEEDSKEAAKWFKLAADQGLSEAQNNLANCFYFGEGVQKDRIEAVKLWKLAADQGLPDAQYNLANCFYDGEGVIADRVEAAKWLKLAADQGHADAQNTLASCFYDGEGIEKDRKEAVKWFTFAANQGDPHAQYNLANCYYNGEGVEKDREEAAKWLKLAAGQGHAAAQNALAACYDDKEGEKDSSPCLSQWNGDQE